MALPHYQFTVGILNFKMKGLAHKLVKSKFDIFL